jgi:hypothetical protein
MPEPVVGRRWSSDADAAEYPGTLFAGDLPEKAANYSSLETFAAKTESDWTDELTGAEINRWGANGVLGGLFQGLVNVGGFVLSLLQTLANNIFAGLNFVFDSVEDALTELGNNFGSWFDSINRASSAGIVGAAGGLAAGVAGGVYLVDEFDRGAASTLGGNYQLYSDGSGGGTFGTNGLGWAGWGSSGGLTRRHISRRTTTLATDYQFVSCVVANSIGGSFVTSHNYLCARMNNAATQADLDCVYVRFGYNTVTLGYVIDGVFTDFVGGGLTRRIYAGDNIQFYVGTDVDDRQFIVKVNGSVVKTFTDSGDLSPLGGKFAGLGAQGVPFSSLQMPAFSLKVWAASDRASTAI